MLESRPATWRLITALVFSPHRHNHDIRLVFDAAAAAAAADVAMETRQSRIFLNVISNKATYVVLSLIKLLCGKKKCDLIQYFANQLYE